ncbi:MAG: tetratricopeptide repeat protein [Candidatus Acidiferrales bacterium]
MKLKTGIPVQWMRQCHVIKTPSAGRLHADSPTNRASGGSAGFSREALLLSSVVLLVIMFAFTAFVARTFHKRIHTFADEWFAQGEAAYQSGDLTAALNDYRNALAYAPNNLVFQFHLAQALAAAGHREEARSYLANLLTDSPGSGEINLELARIAAQEGAAPDAIRFYHSAIYGVWENDPLVMRWRVRHELCQYLLDRGDEVDALPDLIALAQEVPPGDTEREDDVGALLLRAGLWGRALDEFRSVLAHDRHDDVALAGAGKAAFELGQYADALDYFAQLPPEKSSQPDIAGMIETSRAVESASPFLPGLSAADKAKRAADALAEAKSRMADCAHQQGVALSEKPPRTDLQKLYATSLEMNRDWRTFGLERYPERVDAAMSLAFQMESAADEQCGQPQAGPDRILALIAQSRGGATQ